MAILIFLLYCVKYEFMFFGKTYLSSKISLFLLLSCLGVYSSHCISKKIVACGEDLNLNVNVECLLYAPINISVDGTIDSSPLIYKVTWFDVTGATSYSVEEALGKNRQS